MNFLEIQADRGWENAYSEEKYEEYYSLAELKISSVDLLCKKVQYNSI